MKKLVQEASFLHPFVEKLKIGRENPEKADIPNTLSIIWYNYNI